MSQAEKNTSDTRKAFRTMMVRAGIVLAALLVLFFCFRVFDIQGKLRLALDWIESLGVVGPIVFIALYILACVFFVSGAVLTVGAGAVFGLVMGTVYVSIGSILGATTAFVAGRYFTRDWVARKIAGNEKFRAIDEAVAREGWKIVGLTRLSPVFPFVLLNYAFGLTKVSLRDYFLASWICMLPGTVMYVYIGYLGREAAAAEGATGAAQWALRIVGFIATVAVTVLITRIAKRALNRKIDDDESAAEPLPEQGGTA